MLRGWGHGWLGATLYFFFCQEDTPEEAEVRPQRPRSFQQKRDYFQKMGEGAQGGGSHAMPVAWGGEATLCSPASKACPGAQINRPL